MHKDFKKGNYSIKIMLGFTLLVISNQYCLSYNVEEEGLLCPQVEAAQESTADIMNRELIRRQKKGESPAHIQEVKLLERENVPQNPDSPVSSSFSNNLYAPGATMDTTRAIETFLGKVNLTFTAATFNGWFPPDSMGVGGPSQFIVAINGTVKSYNKVTGQADGVLNTTLSNFFESVRNNSNAFDPRIRYDKFSSRWFIICVNSGNPNKILIAVSTRAHITNATQWSFYGVQQDLVSPAGDTGAFADYPTLGIDAKMLYIGVNQFSDTAPVTSTGFVIRKNPLLQSKPLIGYAFRNLSSPSAPAMFTPQGVDNFDPNPAAGYFIGVNAFQRGSLVIRRINNLDGIPTTSAVTLTVPTTAPPLKVPHLGNTNGVNGYLSGVDDRLMSAHIRNGRLWTAHNIGVNNVGVSSPTASSSRNGCRWYEIDLSVSTPTLVQAGTLYQPSEANTLDQRHYWFPGIMSSEQGHVMVGCSVAGAQEYINAGFAYRLSSDPLGQLRTPVLYTKSTTAYNPSYDPGSSARGRRWGDYSYSSLDPDGMTFYTIQEYCGIANQWVNQVAKVLPPPPPSPLHVSPSVVAAGSDPVMVQITASSVEGSGFHPQARVHISDDTRVDIIKTITFNSPTSITFTMVPNWTRGLKNVAVINPDGQWVKTFGILTIQ